MKNKHSEFQNLSNVTSEQNNFTEATETKIIKPNLSCPFNCGIKCFFGKSSEKETHFQMRYM